MKPIWRDAPRVGPDEPWPAYRFTPGAGMPHPIRDPKGHSYGHIDDVVSRPPDEWRQDVAHLRGIDLYHAGYLWEAHEAWEGIWKASEDTTQRAFLQALIQTAAALIKAQTNQPRGVEKLIGRAREHASSLAVGRYMGLDVASLRDAWTRMEKDPAHAFAHAPRLSLET